MKNIVNSIKLSIEDINLLNYFMQENKINNKSEAIRMCIKNAVNKNDIIVLLSDINSKLNRLIHSQYVTRKLLEQMFVCEGYPKLIDPKKSAILKEFNEQLNNYTNNFLG